MYAVNAFNSLKRVAALWNAQVLWPRCSRFFLNTYQGWANLLIRVSECVLYNKQGVIQGFFYVSPSCSLSFSHFGSEKHR